MHLRDTILKNKLEELYSSYQKKFSSKDPVWIVHNFSDENDIEIAALLTSCYSYGHVEQINFFVKKIFDRISNKPYEFTANFSKRKDKKFLRGLSYRFNIEDDLVWLFSSMNKTLKHHQSLKKMFIENFHHTHENILFSLGKFCLELRANSYDKINYLIPDVSKNSTCKRMNMFLRWMVRKDEIDLGLWNKISSSKLIMPVDTHIARVSRKLRLVRRKSQDMKFAVELTSKLKKFDANDPVKYDFSLCHIGIEGKLHDTF